MSDTKEYIFSYQSMLTTDMPVDRHYLLVRFVPVNNKFQTIQDLCVNHYGFDFFNQGRDSFLNPISYGGTLKAHKALMWASSGIVSQLPYKLTNLSDAFIYTLNTDMTAMSAKMTELVESLNIPTNPFDAAMLLNETVYNHFSYTPNVTSMKTTAGEAFDSGMGVCQDYAHVLLAFLRYFKIPSRYVNGFISGDGMTHAWVEILINDNWYGFDPTHNRMIDYGYIKLAHGRDVNDCPVSRGVYTGNATQTMSVHVSVGEL
ncbi:MAG: transglutaminase family protein [Succinivibrio sp.]